MKTNKKVKGDEARAFLQAQGYQEQDRSCPRDRGRSMNMNRVLKYYKRKGIAVESLTRSDQSASENLTPSSASQETQSTPLTPGSSSLGSPSADLTPDSSSHEWTSTDFTPDSSSQGSSLSTTSSPEIVQQVLRRSLPIDLSNGGVSPTNPATLYSRIDSPDSFRATENMFVDITQYFERSITSGVWRSVGLGQRCVNTRRGTPGVYIGEFFHKVNLAASLHDSVQPTMADQSFSEALAFLPAILEKQASSTMSDILRLLAELQGKRKRQIVSQISRHLSTTSASNEVAEDPLTSLFRRIFRQISFLLQEDQSGQVLISATQVIMHTLDRVLNVRHMETIFATRDFLAVMRSLWRHDQISQPLINTHSACVASTGRKSLQSVNLLLEMARIELHAGRTALAADHAEEGISYAKKFLDDGNDTSIALLLDACWISGQAHDKLGTFRTVERRYRQAVSLNVEKYGSSSWSTRRDRSVLWQWLMNQGRADDAVRVKLEGPLLS